MFRPYSKILPFNLITIISKFRDFSNRFIPENGPLIEQYCWSLKVKRKPYINTGFYQTFLQIIKLYFKSTESVKKTYLNLYWYAIPEYRSMIWFISLKITEFVFGFF